MKCSKSRRFLHGAPLQIPLCGTYDAPQTLWSLGASCHRKSQLAPSVLAIFPTRTFCFYTVVAPPIACPSTSKLWRRLCQRVCLVHPMDWSLTQPVALIRGLSWVAVRWPGSETYGYWGTV